LATYDTVPVTIMKRAMLCFVSRTGKQKVESKLFFGLSARESVRYPHLQNRGAALAA